MKRLWLVIILLACCTSLASVTRSQTTDDASALQRKVKELEGRIWNLERKQDEFASQTERKISDLRGDAVGGGLVLFFFAVFCALWAQNTGRSAWLWFFLGLCFHIITALVLLTKNSDNNFERRHFGGTRRID
jgi:hypothetical protein